MFSAGVWPGSTREEPAAIVAEASKASLPVALCRISAQAALKVLWPE
jgi:hypothetical protein